MNINNLNYKTIIVSDIVRDGLGIELWDKGKNEIIAEIFRNDNLNKIQVLTFRAGMPLELFENLIFEFDNEIGRNFQEE